MDNLACSLPKDADQSEHQRIARMLDARRIAVVGASDDPNRASHYVCQYLVSHGYEVVPVNPNVREVLGLRCYPTLADVPGKIDVVNVFRRSDACGEIARQAVAIGTKGIWLQSGVSNAQAERLASEAGIDFIDDRCIMVEHSRARH